MVLNIIVQHVQQLYRNDSSMRIFHCLIKNMVQVPDNKCSTFFENDYI